MMRKDLLDFWQNPNDGANTPESYLKPNEWRRSVQLCEIISELIPVSSQPKILEIGSNTGRNLMLLRFGGYQFLTGLELSVNAVKMMRDTFTDAKNMDIKVGEVEKLIYDLTTDSFDIIFTMAVLQHLPPESEHIFKQIIRVMRGYLVTIEDERWVSWRHFPRRYDRLFGRLGLKQVKVVKNLDGLSKSYICRIFKKERIGELKNERIL